jgi:hypothetical protein
MLKEGGVQECTELLGQFQWTSGIHVDNSRALQFPEGLNLCDASCTEQWRNGGL